MDLAEFDRPTLGDFLVYIRRKSPRVMWGPLAGRADRPRLRAHVVEGP
jgi:hypothetical protein